MLCTSVNPDQFTDPEHFALVSGFETYLRAHVALSTTRVRAHYASRICRWAERLGCGVFELSLRSLCDWLVKDVGTSPNTKNSARASATKFFSWAVWTGKTQENPALQLPEIRRPQGMPRPCPEYVLHRGLANASQPTDVLMLMLGSYGGLRVGEMAQLHTLDVSDGWMYVRGKGERYRWVPLHDDLAELLAMFDHGYFFPSTLTETGHFRPGSISCRVRKLLATPGWSAHTLRHRFAMECYDNEPDLLSLKELLGHARVSSTEIYARAKQGRLIKPVSKLPRMPEASSHLRRLRRAA